MKINVVLTPIIRKEIPALLIQIKEMPPPSNEYITSLVISIDEKWDPIDKEKIQEEFNKNKKLKNCTNIYFLECKIPAEQSVYIKKIDEKNPNKLNFGLKSGPNIQFFKSLQHLIKYKSGEAVLLLEVDAIPLSNCWLDAISKELKNNEFYVAGSKYKGNSKLPDSISGHINGNAIYNISNKDFIEFIDIWESLLKYCITKDPSLAYDVVIPWAIYYKNGLNFNDIDRVESSFLKYFKEIKSILNISGEYENSKNYVQKISDLATQLVDVSVLHSKAALKNRHEILLQHKISNYCGILDNILVYDNNWQYPVITEKHAFESIRKIPFNNNSVIYFAFPWATLIDLKFHNPESLETKELEKILFHLSKFIKHGRKVITVCQHIFLNDYLEIFSDIGITDIFWSHKKIDRISNSSHTSIKTHAFPLYPVQGNILNEKIESFNDRKYQFSFVGAKSKYVGANAKGVYLSNSRNQIIDFLANVPGSFIKGREQWHFEKIVYENQINGKISNADINNEGQNEYKASLRNSIFALCPAGTGPNSIRLWESLSYGAIPVVLADGYCFPGDDKLWDNAVLRVEETEENIRNLPSKLAALQENTTKMEEMLAAGRELWKKYGYDYFVYDIHTLILEAECHRMLAINEKIYRKNNSTNKLEAFLNNYKVKNKKDAQFIILIAGTSALLSPSDFKNLYIKNSQLHNLICDSTNYLDREIIDNFNQILKNRNIDFNLT
jgi:hypothetical protein